MYIYIGTAQSSFHGWKTAENSWARAHPHCTMESSLAYDPLNPALESMHLNFRDMRQVIEVKMKHIQEMTKTGAPQSDIKAAIAALRKQVQRAKQKQAELSQSVEARELCYSNFVKATSSDPNGSVCRSYYMLMQIANRLAEGGNWPALDLLTNKFPILNKLVDFDSYKTLHELLVHLQRREFGPLLKWTKKHRSALKRASGDMELRLQMMEITAEGIDPEVKLMLLQRVLNSGDHALADAEGVNAAINSLYGSVRLDPQSTVADDTWKRIIDTHFTVSLDDFDAAYRKTLQLPPRNALINYVLVGLSLFKTKSCLEIPTLDTVRPVDQEIYSQIRSNMQHAHEAEGQCIVCAPHVRQLSHFLPYAGYSESCMPQVLVKTRANYVIDYTELERYMHELWPDLLEKFQYYDVTGELCSIDSLQTVFSL